MIRTGRFENGQTCQYNGSGNESCWNSINQGLNFTETATKEDYKAMDRAYSSGIGINSWVGFQIDAKKQLSKKLAS